MRRTGVRSQTAHFVIYLANLPDQPQPRLGLAVSRRVGNAVIRNRIKRRVRESFRCSLKAALDSSVAMVTIAREGAAKLRTPQVTAELKPAIVQMLRKLDAGRGARG